jgi:hypothetical protein
VASRSRALRRQQKKRENKTMKRIEYPGPIAIVALDGTPVPGDDNAPASWQFKHYARLLLMQPKFPEGLDAIDAASMQLDMKRLLDGLGDGAGFVDVENDHHKRLLAAARELKLPPAWGYCVLPFAVAIRDAKEPPKLEALPVAAAE